MIRPRFSIRAILILVTFAGIYLGCWQLTKRGLPHVDTDIANESEWCGRFDDSLAPFVISREEHASIDNSSPVNPVPVRRCYHLWFFGHTAKLPFERNVGIAYVEIVPLTPLVQYDDIDVYDDEVVKPVQF